MLDFDNLTIQFNCPKCGFPNEALTREFAVGATIMCRGCKEYVQLVDLDGSVKKAGQDFDRSMGELEKAFEKAFEINLKL
jgi:transcription initiation factor IIE alpha subunit